MRSCWAWIGHGLALVASAVALGCDPLHPCSDTLCGGAVPEVALVDEAGDPALVRGEYRLADSSGTGAGSFDCARRAPGAAPGWPCSEGTLSLPVDDVRPELAVELRFVLADGSWSAWQAVELEITRQTDPEFNGPDCPCSWYSATATPAVVPAEARRAAP